MEHLRHVARAGRADPTAIVVETVDALARLRPDASELVPLCRNLVERHPACGPLWWLCARLLADPATVDNVWELADHIEHDPTVTMLSDRLPDDGAVLAVGDPVIVANALCDRPDVRLFAVDAGSRSGLFGRLDMLGALVDLVAPEAMLAAARRADVVLVEAESCCADTVVTSMGGALAAVAAASVGAPVWVIAGRGRRLPARYVEAIAARVTGGVASEFETFSPELARMIAGPDGVMPTSADALAPECPAVPELVPS